MKNKLRFAVIGCGFWAKYQIAGWKELEGVELVALYNRTLDKAAYLAAVFDVPRVYDDIDLLFENEKLDFVDIITDVSTHAEFTILAASLGIPVICQKPMASDLLSAKRMLDICKQRGIPLYIHENFRWQAPIRKIKQLLDSKVIGEPFKARISYCSNFPVVEKQPFLAELDNFILTDIGSHVLDITRFLFGETRSLYCKTSRVNPNIRGEDVANVCLVMETGMFCLTEMSYASILETESFPQTLVNIEGSIGSLQLLADYQIRLTTKAGTEIFLANPIFYEWLDPEYAVVQSSIVDCNRNILQALQNKEAAETTAEDNFETVKLVWAAYESARNNQVIEMKMWEKIFSKTKV